MLDAHGLAWDLDDFFLDSHGVEAPEGDVFELFAQLGYPPDQVNEKVRERYRAHLARMQTAKD